MKLTILTSSRHGTASICLPRLHADGLEIARVVVSRNLPDSRWRHLRRKFSKARQIGFLGALNGIRMRSWYDGAPTPDIGELCVTLGIPMFETDQTNSALTKKLFHESEADLGLSLGNSYISKRIFSIPRCGMINVHGERLPEYRNAQSVIWPIYFGETNTGITVHRVETVIDGGDILYKEEIPIAFGPTLEETVRHTIQRISDRVPDAVSYVCRNFSSLSRESIAQTGGGKYTTPSYSQYRRMKANNHKLFSESLDSDAS